MNKRSVIFVLTSLVVLFIYMMIVSKMGLLPIPADIPEEDRNLPTATMESASDVIIEQHNQLSIPDTVEMAATVTDEIETVVESNLYRVVLSNRGGVIKRWELKEYTKSYNSTTPVLLFPSPKSTSPVMPLTISGDGVSTDLPTAIYQQKGEGGNVGSRGLEIVFYLDQDGKKIIKTLTFTPGSYTVNLKIETIGFEGGYLLALGSNFGMPDMDTASTQSIIGPAVMLNEELERYKISKLEASQEIAGAVSWVAQQDKYFIASYIPKTEASSFTIVKRDDDPEVNLALGLRGDGLFATQDITIFAGPKQKEILEAVGLEKSLNFGYFMFGTWSFVASIAQMLFGLLNIIYSFTNNYGIAIILLTTLVKVVLFPLTHKSFSSMKAMQKVQPKIKKLQSKHKNDKELLNLEMIKLYKENNINPMAGCFPMVLQLPVFIALYNLLSTAIELRQAPFLFWLTDLSIKDPYYTLPIIMGGSMFLQQQLQPTQSDAAQAKMMKFLPIIFTAMFLNFPSGLVLYWLTNNVLTITQQLLTQKLIDRKEMAKAIA